MKIFNTLHELWNHCKFCPICQKDCREIVIEVGPDEDFTLLEFHKIGNTLFLDCEVDSDDYQKFTCSINLDLGQFAYFSQSGYDVDELDGSEFFFYINADCKNCELSSLSTVDIIAEYNDPGCKYVAPLIEREDIYIVNGIEGFHLTYMYHEKHMILSKVGYHTDIGLVDDNKWEHFPIIELDLSDIDRAIHRLKTIVVFS